MKSQALIVAGMHRSGTSAATGALASMGVALGPNLLEGGQDNPKGYFEHAAVVAAHERLISNLGSWWFDPRPLPIDWMRSPAAVNALETLLAVVESDFSDAGIWAIKDPRVCRLLPLWRKLVDRRGDSMSVLLVLRHPAEVAQSLLRRNGFSRSLALTLWLRHTVDAIVGSEGLPRAVLHYPALLGDPNAALRDVLRKVGVEPVGQVDPDFVDDGLRHHDAECADSFEAGSDSERMALDLYAAMQRAAIDEADWSGVRACVEEYSAWWQSNAEGISSIAEALYPTISRAEQLSEELRSARSDLNAQVRWSEEAVIEHRKTVEYADSLKHSLEEQRGELGEALASRAALESELAVALRDLDRARSELAAQVRWAEGAVKEHQGVAERAAMLGREIEEQREHIGELAEARSALESELAVTKRDLDHARSELAAQVRWAEQAVKEHQGVAEKVVRLSATIDEKSAAIEALESERVALRLSLAQSEAAHLREIAELSSSKVALSAHVESLRDQIAAIEEGRLNGLIKALSDLGAAFSGMQARTMEMSEATSVLHQQLAEAQDLALEARAEASRAIASLETLTSTFSWRVTKPLRWIRRLFLRR